MRSSGIEKREKNFYRLLMIVAWLFYIATITQKNLYSAEIVPIIAHFGTGKAAASLATTCYFVVYAVTQVILIKLLPKLNIKNFLTVTVGISAVVDLMIVFCTDIRQIWVLFAIIGVLQAGSWPGCILLISRYLPHEMQTRANQLFGCGFAVGLVLDYGMSALMIQLFDDWKIAFWIVNIMLAALSVFLFIILHIADRIRSDRVITASSIPVSDVSRSRPADRKKLAFFIVLSVVITTVGYVAYTGINNWVPSLLFDRFHLPVSLSTLLAITVPGSTIFGPLVVIPLCDRKDLWRIARFLTIPMVGFVLVMTLVYDVNLVLSLALSILFLIGARCITSIFTTVVPVKCAALVNAGSMAAIMNAAGSLGSALGPPLMGSILDRFETSGWVIAYSVIAALTVVMLITALLGKRYARIRDLSQKEKEYETL